MEDFIQYLIQSFVSEPEEIDIEAVDEDKGLTLELALAPEDRDMLLADRAQLANALRTMLDAWGTKHRRRARLWILDDDDFEDDDEGEEEDD